MDKYYMKIAMRNAEKARGKCSPNPFVGAVIVKDGHIIGEGHTQPYGQDHAEIVALKEAKTEAKGATLYVTMEPCSHFGKTPPCADAIIKAGIKRVVIGIIDPNPITSGKGIRKLQEANIQVLSGLLEEEIKEQLEYYLCYTTKHRPFVIWKCALTLDGRYAASDGSSKWITNPASRKYVHRLRSKVDAVLAGVSSVNIDDAMLNARGLRNINQPLRVVLDPSLKIELNSALVKSAKEFPALIFYSKADEEKIKRLQEMGVTLKKTEHNKDGLELKEVLKELHQMNITSIVLETGNRLSESFWREKLIDKCVVFYGNQILGGDKCILKRYDRRSIDRAINLAKMKVNRLQDNLVITGYPLF